MNEEIGGSAAIKEFFGDVSTKELIELRKGSPEGYSWLAAEAAKALGKRLRTTTAG